MTVHELLASLDSAELTEWMAYLELEAAGAKPEQNEEEAWKRAFACG